MNINTLIAYPYFPHYRLAILKELAKDRDISYTFLAGTTPNIDIKTIDLVENKLNWKIIENIWLFDHKLLWQRGLIQECVFGDYDVVILLGYPYALSTWFASLLSRLSGKIVLFWAHAIVRNQKRDKLKVLFYKLAHGLLLYGNWAKQNLTRHGFNQAEMFVVYNSLDYDHQLHLRKLLTPEKLISEKKMLFNNPGNPVLLFIGRLTSSKRLNQLIAACEKLHGRGMPVNMLFIGDGEERRKLHNLCDQKNLLPYTTFLGECYDEQKLAALIAMADVCISPGNVGLTAMHSLMYGTPVITHNNPFDQMPEFEAITQGETGMFFEQGSVESLTETIYTWLQLNQNKRDQIRNKCYKIIDKYYNPAFQAKEIKVAILKYYSPRKKDL